RIRANLQLNDLVNVEMVEAAASDEQGTATLFLAADPAFHSISHVDAVPVAGTTTVQTTTLDILWRDGGMPTVSLLKIDAEGAEMDILRGASELLARDHPAILIELVDSHALVANWLAERGYTETVMNGMRPWNHVFQAT